MKQLSLVLLCLLAITQASAQLNKRALFLGNSYTYYNNLPQLTVDVALSAGDTLEVGSSTPGGYTFEDHLSNSASMSLIAEGTWDYVVLQQQSQMPAFPLSQVEVETFPFATQLNEAILTANPCAETIFYMTWGRENGDQQNCAGWPPVCTYEGMDDLLRERYLMMAEMNQGIVSPVGAVWRYLRENHPGIGLFASDGSHPSPEGSYAAALAFYTSIFRKSPLATSYNYTIADSTEAIMRSAVHEVVFNQFSQWYIGTWDPIAAGNIEPVIENEFQLTNTSQYSTEVYYSLDGEPLTALTSDIASLYVNNYGQHAIELIAGACGVYDTTLISFDFVSTVYEVNQSSCIQVYPNPSADSFRIEFNNPASNFELIITDHLGRVIPFSYLRNGTNMIIDCSSWDNGVYSVYLENDSQQQMKRVVVMHN
ncbi:MAG: T9SS type A sorting domain-containing protein [Flavobacteriales bacterium]|jgi:hypothetical protein